MRMGRVSSLSSPVSYIELMFISLEIEHPWNSSLSVTAPLWQVKSFGRTAPVFTTPDDQSCLPGGTGAKLALHNQGRVRDVAGDRGRRFYRIERRGRVERGGPRRRDGLRSARP